MIRLFRFVRLFALLVLLLTAAGAAWIAGTTAGARWLLDAASRYSTVDINVRTVEGRLLDRLGFAEIKIGLAQQKVEIDRLVLDWHLLHLALGRVDINGLAAEGIRIQDNGPRAPLSLQWPRASGALHFFTGKVSHLTVKDIEYRKQDDPPVIVDSISAVARWQGGHLQLTRVQVAMPSGKIEGQIEVGLRSPSLATDLTLYPEKPIEHLERFNLQTRLKPGKEPEQATGPFTLSGVGKTARNKQIISLSGEAGVTRTAINLRRLRLTGEGLRGTITGAVAIDFKPLDPLIIMNLHAAGVDLTPQLDAATNLGGTLAFNGTARDYRGHFTLTNTGKAWRAGRFSGTYAGNDKGLELTSLAGTVLAGTVGGSLKVDWRDGIRIGGAVRGRNLNPAGIMPDWRGVVNFNLAGHVFKAKGASLQGAARGTLLDSRLHGQVLTGDLQGTFAGDSVRIDSLNLRGKGFRVHAAGELDKRMAVSAKIDDLSRFIPGASGTLLADGWVRRRQGRLSGDIRGHGRTIALDGIRIDRADLAARLGPEKDAPLYLTATLRSVLYNHLKADAVMLEAKGTTRQHTIHGTVRATGAEALLELAGGYYEDGWWRGKILRFAGHDRIGPWNLSAPADVVLGKGGVTLQALILAGMPGEGMEADAHLVQPGLRGTVSIRTSGLNLARLNPWLKGIRVEGSASGDIRLDLAETNRFTVGVKASSRGSLDIDGERISVQRLDATLQGNEKGLTGTMEIRLPEKGELSGTMTCTFPVRSFVPDGGDIQAKWSNLDLSLFRHWLPREVGITGHLSGGLTGIIHPEKRFELTGTTALIQGTLRKRRVDADISTQIDKADVVWSWREEGLSGSMTLALAEYGQARGRFQLPVPARFPIVADPQGPVNATLAGQIRERGLLTVLFPGAVQESQGEMDADITVSGRWSAPQMAGKLRLAKAGAYIPSAGIRLKDVELTGRFEKETIRIDSFRAVSGSGHIEGTASLQLKQWQVSGYRISMTGERFCTVYFPELQLYASPRLTFEGTPNKLTVRGEVHLPEVHITGSPVRDVIATSQDIVIEGRAPEVKTKEFPVDLDARVRITLGDRAFVKLAGIDAQLGGAVELTALHNLDRITSTGEIKVIKGRYQTYGVTLQIVRGRLFYAGVPINKPALDILALRTLGTVKAGVTVGGTLQKPVINLYAEPPMQDVDILSYIVLGHPLGESGGQTDLLAMAAGALLSAGQSVVLQDKIAKRLGLSSLEIQTRGKSTSAWDAYTKGPLSATGSATATSGSDLSQAMLTVGKYLTPKLYISYGRSLYTGSNLFLLRYDLHRHWQVETQTGTESGVDLFYKIEFK